MSRPPRKPAVFERNNTRYTPVAWRIANKRPEQPWKDWNSQIYRFDYSNMHVDEPRGKYDFLCIIEELAPIWEGSCDRCGRYTCGSNICDACFDSDQAHFLTYHPGTAKAWAAKAWK